MQVAGGRWQGPAWQVACMGWQVAGASVAGGHAWGGRWQVAGASVAGGMHDVAGGRVAGCRGQRGRWHAWGGRCGVAGVWCRWQVASVRWQVWGGRCRVAGGRR